MKFVKIKKLMLHEKQVFLQISKFPPWLIYWVFLTSNITLLKSVPQLHSNLQLFMLFLFNSAIWIIQIWLFEDQFVKMKKWKPHKKQIFCKFQVSTSIYYLVILQSVKNTFFSVGLGTHTLPNNHDIAFQDRCRNFEMFCFSDMNVEIEQLCNERKTSVLSRINIKTLTVNITVDSS